MDVQESGAIWWPVLRFLLGLGGAVALGYGAAALLILGFVVFVGCFWACSNPNPQPLLGMMIICGSVAAASGAVTSLVAAFVGRRAPLRTIFLVGCVFVAAALGLAVVAS